MNQNNDLANSAASPSGGSGYTLNHIVNYGGYDNPAQVQDYQASDELTRNGLRAEAAFNTPMVQLIIKDFCDLSERLEQIRAMAPTQSGLQYWVRDSANGRGIIVAECVELLRYAPGYTVRVPRDVRLAFEALNTLELVNQAMYHSLSGYLRYLEAQQPAQALQAYQPPPPPILLKRQDQIVVPQGPRTSGVRSSGSAGIHRYEWPESRKLAWLCITPRMVLPEKALESSYCSFNSVALWDHVDVRLIGPNIEVTLVEIAAFFPRAASCWRAIWKRFEASGWNLHKLRELIFYSRQLSVGDLRAHSAGSMKKHRRDARDHSCAAAGLTLSAINTDRVNSTTEFCDLRDCFLVSLGDGLVYWPGGADQGVLTLAVWHARRHGHNNVRLSQLERYVEQVQEEMAKLYGPLPQPSPLGLYQTDWEALERIFPQQTYDATRVHDPTYDVVRKWWAAGRYFHQD